MNKVRTILRMHFLQNHQARKISKTTGIPYSTVYDNIKIAQAKNLVWSQIKSMNDEKLNQALSCSKIQRALPDWGYIDKELKKREVTIKVLWLEYKSANPVCYQYSRFLAKFRDWQNK